MVSWQKKRKSNKRKRKPPEQDRKCEQGQQRKQAKNFERVMELRSALGIHGDLDSALKDDPARRCELDL